MDEVLTRADMKRFRGKIIDYTRRGEVTEQIWELPDGSQYRGDDWYNDVTAKVYCIRESKITTRCNETAKNAVR